MTKKEKEAKVVLERTYNVPLRKEFIKVPKYKRAKKAVIGLKKFLKRHMKAEDIKNVKIGKYANLEIWKNGIKNPPHHIKVNVKKDDKGIVFAELVGAPEERKEIKKPEVKKEIKEEEKKEDVKEKRLEDLRRPEETEEKKEKDKILTKRL